LRTIEGVRTEDIENLIDLTGGRVRWRKFGAAEKASGRPQSTVNEEERVLVKSRRHLRIALRGLFDEVQLIGSSTVVNGRRSAPISSSLAVIQLVLPSSSD